MEEKTTESTRYHVLDVRELTYADNSQGIVLICKEHNRVNRRRIVVWDDNDKIFDDAKMLVPGDFIIVHERIYGHTRTIEEIEC